MSGQKTHRVIPVLAAIFLVCILIGSTLPPRPAYGPAVAAQSTGDVLPTRTPTPAAAAPPAATATATPALIRTVWVGRLVSNTLGATQGQGSIFRVSIEGRPGALIELRADDQLITGQAGSKPEYGPHAAEFAPVTAGTWTVSAPDTGASIQVAADNYNLAVIEFVQIPEAEATQAALPNPTSTPLGGQLWAGQVAQETPGIGSPFARLLVQVTGRSGQPVRLATFTEVINTANTGQKPELGPDVVEFAGLSPGRYIVEPLGLNSSLEVELKANIETRVEFEPQAPTPTPLPAEPTATPFPTQIPLALPPTATATATGTPAPTFTLVPSSTSTPLPSPTPVSRWLGRVAERHSPAGATPVLKVQVLGIEGVPVRLRSLAAPGGERRCITGQGAAGQDACIFENPAPGQYITAPEGLGLSLPVTVPGNENITVLFGQETYPAGVTGWQARLVKNSNSARATGRADSLITARVLGQPGQVVALRSVRGEERFCEVEPNPVLGGPVCEFGELLPGVYQVEALNTGASLRLFVDGLGRAEVEFSPSATSVTEALGHVPSQAGHGAQPSPTAEAAATPTPTAAATATPLPPRPTATPTATVTPTPTTALAWQGRIVQVTDEVAGAIGVRAAGLKDHPVILRSGGWQSPAQLTGTKPELGEYAVEFGGLAQGTYIVELVNLAEFTVNLGPGQFVLVEFRYEAVANP